MNMQIELIPASDESFNIDINDIKPIETYRVEMCFYLIIIVSMLPCV